MRAFLYICKVSPLSERSQLKITEVTKNSKYWHGNFTSFQVAQHKRGEKKKTRVASLHMGTSPAQAGAVERDQPAVWKGGKRPAAVPPPARGEPALPIWGLLREERESRPALLCFLLWGPRARGGARRAARGHGARQDRAATGRGPAGEIGSVQLLLLGGLPKLEELCFLLRCGLSSGFVGPAAAVAFVILKFLLNSVKTN